MEKDVPRTVSPETAGKWRKTYWTSAGGPACHSRWLQCHWGGCNFVSRKKGRHTELTWNTCRKWIWKIIFPWSSKVAVLGPQGPQNPMVDHVFPYQLLKPLWGYPFSAQPLRWSSWIIIFMNHINIIASISTNKKHGIPTLASLTHSTPRFCRFRKKNRRLRCHVTGYAPSVSSPGYRWLQRFGLGSPLGIIGGMNPGWSGPDGSKSLKKHEIV